MNADTFDAALKQLKRGLAQGAANDTYAGHRALLQFGQPAIAGLEPEIIKADWSSLTQPGMIQLLSGYMGLIHEIDETASHRIMDTVVKRGCDPSIQSLFNSIRRWSKGDYAIDTAHGCEIWIEKSLPDTGDIRAYVEDRLMNVPAADLAGIERLSVVPHVDTMDYAGNYMPVLASIVLLWPNQCRRSGMVSWLYKLNTERTLYHEVGHHCLKHEFGQDSDQEKEADRYASRLFAAAHPKLTTFISPIARVLAKAIK